MEQTKKSTYKLLFYLKKNGTPKTMGTKLEIDPNIWDLKFGRVEGKSAKALSINQKLDNIRGRIDKIYEDMLKTRAISDFGRV